MQYNLEVIMRNRWKKTAAAAVAGCLAAGVLAGCGTKHIDPEKYATTVVATVGDQKIYLDEANYMLRGQQYGLENVYSSFGYDIEMFWKQAADDSTTMEQYLRTAVMTELVQEYVLNAKAEELGVSLSDADKEKIQTRIAEDEKLEEKFLTAAGFTKELAERVYTNNALAVRVYEKLVEDVDTEVDEAEFRHVKADYLYLKNATDETGSTAAATTAAAEDSTEGAKDDGSADEADADELLEQLKAAEGDVDKVYEAHKDKYDTRLSKVLDRSIGETATEGNDLYAAIFEMKSGEYKKLYLEGKGWYVIYCETDDDEDGKQQAIKDEINNRKSELFVTKYKELTADGPEIKVEYDIWNSMAILGNSVYEAPETTAASTTESSSETQTTAAAETTEAGTGESTSETATAAK